MRNGCLRHRRGRPGWYARRRFCPKTQPGWDIAGQRVFGIGEEGVVDTANVEGEDLVGLAIVGEVAEQALQQIWPGITPDFVPCQPLVSAPESMTAPLATF